MGDIAPGGRGVTALPPAPTITDQQRTPEADGHDADSLPGLEGCAIRSDDESADDAVRQQRADLVEADGLVGTCEPGAAHPFPELGRFHDDDHVRTLAVHRGRLTEQSHLCRTDATCAEGPSDGGVIIGVAARFRSTLGLGR